jgi:hypothetical protein
MAREPEEIEELRRGGPTPLNYEGPQDTDPPEPVEPVEGYYSGYVAAAIMSCVAVAAGLGFSIYVWRAVLDAENGENWAMLGVLVLLLPFALCEVISWSLALTYAHRGPTGRQGMARVVIVGNVIVGTVAPLVTWIAGAIYKGMGQV